MSTASEHFEIASLRFNLAEEQYADEQFHTAAHLYINSAVLFTNFLFQKYLDEVPSRKLHSDLDLLNTLVKYLKDDFREYKSLYYFLMSYKNTADYGTHFSENICKQIKRKAEHLKEIVDSHYP